MCVCDDVVVCVYLYINCVLTLAVHIVLGPEKRCIMGIYIEERILLGGGG